MICINATISRFGHLIRSKMPFSRKAPEIVESFVIRGVKIRDSLEALLFELFNHLLSLSLVAMIRDLCHACKCNRCF